MEFKILYSVQFSIQKTSPYRFLERFSQITKLDSVSFFLAQYLLELALLDSKMNKYKPSLLASSAIYVAKLVIGKTNTQLVNGRHPKRASGWKKQLEAQSHYTQQDFYSCAKNFAKLANLIMASKLQTVLKKFMQPKFLEVPNLINDYLTKRAEAAKASSKDLTNLTSVKNQCSPH